uniref:Uncharacterized protein n=1 Tax=Sphaerodactylus townsendi TaxID=933632 RepID=A0ACB8FWZ7_9SAUR
MENQGAGGGEEEPGRMNPKRGGSGRVPEEENKNKPKLVSEGQEEGMGGWLQETKNWSVSIPVGQQGIETD